MKRAGLLTDQELSEPDDAIERRPQLMRHVGKKTVLGQQRSFQLHIFFLQRLLDPFPLGHVPNRAREEKPLFCFEPTETDLDRKFASIFAQSVKLQIHTRGARFRRRKKTRTMPRMHLAKSFRHQHFDLLVEQLFAFPPEECDRQRVNQDDFSFAIYEHHRVRRRFQKTAEFLFGFLPTGDVARGTRHHGPFFGIAVHDKRNFLPFGTQTEISWHIVVLPFQLQGTPGKYHG